MMKRFRPWHAWSSFFRERTARLAGSRRGAAAVEFALLVPVILAGLTGVANYGLAMHDKMELVSAARAGAQLAINDRSDTAAIKQAVVDSTELSINPEDVITLETCWCADTAATQTCGVSCDNGDDEQFFMDITVSETFTLMLLGTTLDLSGSVRVRTE